MSKGIWNGKQSISRQSFKELGICKERYLELRSGCGTGKYSRRTLSEACRGLEDAEPWILLSVTQNKSYDALRVKWELKEMGRIPYCRTDFYALRRQFYHNLDCLLRTERKNARVKEGEEIDG